MMHAKLAPIVADPEKGVAICMTCQHVYPAYWVPTDVDEEGYITPAHYVAGACPQCPELDQDLDEAIRLELELRREAMLEKGLEVEEVLTVEEFKRRLVE